MPLAPELDEAVALRRLERAENFPVALRLVPRRHREHLRAVYGVARLIDDAGDDPAVTADQRLRLLDRLAADLETAFAGSDPSSDVVRALAPAIAAGRVSLEPFLDLVAANRLDQTTRRYPSYDDLRHYCTLSANPVGRLVLDVFAVDGETERALSDDVCTALQILEHCQDVAEDLRLRDRIYLPLEDLERFGVGESDLRGPVAAESVRRLVRFEVDRAADLLRGGRPLVGLLRGAARLAVAGYVAGGLATVAAIRDARHDVLAHVPRPRRRDVARHALALGVRGR